MKIGAMIFATDQSIKMTCLAPALEVLGFESLWLPKRHTFRRVGKRPGPAASCQNGISAPSIPSSRWQR